MNYGAGTIRFSRMATRFYIPLGRPRVSRLVRRRPSTVRMWAAAELRRHDVRQLLEAANATTQFDSRGWIGEIDVPTAVVVTTRDRAIPPAVQRHLAESIPGATVHEIDDDHTACGHAAFGPVLRDACLDVRR